MPIAPDVVALAKRFTDRFSQPDDLRRFLKQTLVGIDPGIADGVLQELPGDPIAMAELADRAADVLVRRGLHAEVMEALGHHVHTDVVDPVPPDTRTARRVVGGLALVGGLAVLSALLWPSSTWHLLDVSLPDGVRPDDLAVKCDGAAVEWEGAELKIMFEGDASARCTAQLGVGSGWRTSDPGAAGWYSPATQVFDVPGTTRLDLRRAPDQGVLRVSAPAGPIGARFPGSPLDTSQVADRSNAWWVGAELPPWVSSKVPLVLGATNPFSLPPASGPSPAGLRVQVVDANDQKPIKGVIVTYEDKRFVTDAEGYFPLPLLSTESDLYDLGCTFDRPGYLVTGKTIQYTPDKVVPGYEVVGLTKATGLFRAEDFVVDRCDDTPTDSTDTNDDCVFRMQFVADDRKISCRLPNATKGPVAHTCGPFGAASTLQVTAEELDGAPYNDDGEPPNDNDRLECVGLGEAPPRANIAVTCTQPDSGEPPNRFTFTLVPL